jgi:rare lipoprotein A
MRPQLTRRARRAAGALGALALGAAISGTAASASGSRAHAQTTHRARAHPPARPRTHVPLRLHAQLLHANVLIGHDVAFIGETSPGVAHRPIAVQERRGARWIQVARTRTDRRGHFLERFWPRRLGRLALRLRAGGLTVRHMTVVGRIATVYHQVLASWYGPGGRTACGEALGAATMGVANRALPCGTMVSLHYRGRTVRVPVIDRGPYVAGRDYDLSYATRRALGAGDVSEIWASA